jgi:threonine/homoserine/homoserine lactone efflux protein
MRLAKIFLLAFVTGFSGAMMPGPLLAMTIGQVSLTGSWLVGPLLIVGHAALEMVVVGLLIAGLAPALRRRGPRAVISLVGGLALLLMGLDMLRSARGMALGAAGATEALPIWGLIAAGAAISAANPTFPIWWATVGAGGLAQFSPRTAAEYLSFYLGHELSDLVWYTAVAVVLVTGRGWLSSRLYGALVLLCGLAVLALALWFMYTGVQVFRGRAEKTPAQKQLMNDD